MGIKLEAGQWYRSRGGEICFVVGRSAAFESGADCWVVEESHGANETFTEDGFFLSVRSEHHRDLIEHIPDCTGFDWVPAPKLQLREGAWYERADGNIVGPCERCEESTTILTDGIAKWRIGCLWYSDVGTCPVYSNYLIREVEPPKPKYRAFKNRNEALSHCEGWWLDEAGAAFRVMRVESGGVTVYGCFMSFDVAFERLKRQDGSPFGVLDDGV
jgi:hypothetical protein